MDKCRRCGMPLPEDCILRHDSPDECFALVMAQADALEAIKNQAKEVGELVPLYLGGYDDSSTNLIRKAEDLLAAIKKLEG